MLKQIFPQKEPLVAENFKSISKKYNFGYILTLFALCLVFLVSIVCNRYITGQYNKEMDRLLHFNNLFTSVETTNGFLFDSVTYLRMASIEEYRSSVVATNETAEIVHMDMAQNWTREVADLYYLVETYINQSEEIAESIVDYLQTGTGSATPDLWQQYDETQKTVSYINRSFRDVYSAELLITEQMKENIQKLNTWLTAIQGGLVLLSFAAFFLFHGRVVRSISRSINQLTSFASLVSKAPMEQTEIKIQTHDEIEVFAEAFNNMLKTIQEQMKQIKEDSKIREQLQRTELENMRISSALQSSQLKLLQARVNPHFLFNTLNIISQTAYIENAEDTAQLIEYTANYLRYNLGRITKPVTVSEEIENVRQYAYIQKKRFGKRIEFFFSIDEESKKHQLPCMVLQPLVENSIVHGLKNVLHDGKIWVKAYTLNSQTFLEVQDNGEGISPEMQMRLQESFKNIQNDFESHIGLQNVYLRLKQFFGKELVFNLERKDEITIVKIIMPYTNS